MEERIRVAVHYDGDIVEARQQGRQLAARLGFSTGDLTLIATAISELARNILLYARIGEITIYPQSDRIGIVVEARDQGPGISDVERAMQDGYSTSRGLGIGLPGTRRIMDEFAIESQVGQGTTVIVKKWLRGRGM